MRRFPWFASVALWIVASATASAETIPGFVEPPRLAGETVQPPAAQATPDISPPDLPAVVVTIDPPSAAVALSDVEIAAPDLPPVTVIVEAAPASPKPDVAIAPPDLPDIHVVIDAPTQAPVVTKMEPASHVAVTAALKERLVKNGSPAHARLTKTLREEIAAFYGARDHAPLWVMDAGVTSAGRALAARLASAEEDALDPAAYPFARSALESSDVTTLAGLDLDLSVAAVIYARDARGGRIDARRLSNLIDPTIDLPGAAETLQMVSTARDAGAALGDFNPPHAGYRGLREKLREARQARQAREPVASVTIPQGPVLRVGMNDLRVPLVRERLRIEPRHEPVYDASVAEAVAGFQRQRGLPATGSLTRQTVAALSSGVETLEADIIANMERWRWLPRDLGQRHVIVNVPEFQVRVMDGASVIHQARVIVGKPDTPTPVFSDKMQFLVVNPSWFVPPSILKKEFLPKLATDPTYAERRGYQVIRNGNNITIRQPPGERNALGNIKFMFPNRHAVYLHDTPTRHLFGAERRAFSHGCVRVDHPLRLAEIVLGGSWTEAKVRSLIGRGERPLKLDVVVPVHLTYFTSFVDDLGRLQQRDDLYGHNRRVRAALGLNG